MSFSQLTRTDRQRGCAGEGLTAATDHNGGYLEEGESPVAEDAFVKKAGKPSITIGLDGETSFTYGQEDLTYGHEDLL
ncbi:MAG: hypothetical protein MI919_21105 [Holophagales bacterium]|nr:hypothetical protein [Holophagales bacterium]